VEDSFWWKEEAKLQIGEFRSHVCRCKIRRFDGVRGRCVPGLGLNFEGVSCTMEDRIGDNLLYLKCQSLVVVGGGRE
jgi:hypothetical protein